MTRAGPTFYSDTFVCVFTEGPQPSTVLRLLIIVDYDRNTRKYTRARTRLFLTLVSLHLSYEKVDSSSRSLEYL